MHSTWNYLKKNRVLINSETAFIALITTYAFLQMSPYFTWYYSSIVSFFCNTIIPLICIFFGMLNLHGSVEIKKALSALLLLFFGAVLTIRTGSNLNGFIVHMVTYMSVAVFICQTTSVKMRSFSLFCKVFALALIPGIIFFILKVLGISMIHSVIYSLNPLKTIAGHYYEKYFGCVIYCTRSSYSFCGMYDEPGAVGTFSGLLLAARMVLKHSGGKAYHISYIECLLVIAGILSSSKAFFVILFIIALFWCLTQKKIKAFFGILTLCVLLTILLNVETNYVAFNQIQTIINSYISTGTISLGRAHVGFNEEFNSFLRGPIKYVLFGHGLGSSQRVAAFAGSAEIRMLIYDIGILGTIFEVFWLTLSYYTEKKNENGVLTYFNLFLFVFLLSMYQRQYVMTPNYLITLFGGGAFISCNTCWRKMNQKKSYHSI